MLENESQFPGLLLQYSAAKLILLSSKNELHYLRTDSDVSCGFSLSSLCFSSTKEKLLIFNHSCV